MTNDRAVEDLAESIVKLASSEMSGEEFKHLTNDEKCISLCVVCAKMLGSVGISSPSLDIDAMINTVRTHTKKIIDAANNMENSQDDN